MTSTTSRALLQCFRPTVDSIRADLEAVAAQHGAADPRAAAEKALRHHGGALATALHRLRAEVAAEAAHGG